MIKKSFLGAAAVIVAGIGWYLFRPELLFVNKTANDAFPTASAAGSGPVTLAAGDFHSVAHQTIGKATVYKLADGSKVLRFTDFETSNGPDVHVYLVAADDAKDSSTVKLAGFVDLGSIKGNQGDQNYTLPADLDLKKYRAATIWCKRFSVNFATAPLMAQAAASGPVALAAGQFHSVAHRTSGTATVYDVSGKRVLRLTDFETSNGPDVHVYLVAAPDAKDSATVKSAGFVDLGSIKGNQGDQNYDLPADLDLKKYQAATIWCKRFSVNFATAPLASRQG